MDSIKCMLTRRSVRNFKPEPVPKHIMDTILACAIASPSARDEKPWNFIVMTDSKTLEKIPAIHPNAKMAAHAPAGIIVCADLSSLKTEGYWPQDCAAATMSILLAAHSLGLGAVWTGIYPREERIEAFRKLLGIPEHVVPFAFVPIGYPAETKKKEDRFENGMVHWEKW